MCRRLRHRTLGKGITMAAQYWVTLATDRGEELVTVYSADARSFRAVDIRLANRKARMKAEAKLKRQGRDGRAIRIQCVG